jgi:hypothetical protein
MRQQIATTIGVTYWWTFELQTTTISCWRAIGTAPGGTDIFSLNVASNPETKLVFTATTTSVWLDLTRTSSNTTRTGNHRFEEAPPGAAMARRINGVNQYFGLDVAASGFRTANTLQYIGGWFKFQYVPTSNAYILDWAVPDVGSLGDERARILYDPTVPKIMASNGAGGIYIEDRHTGAAVADVWRYIGMSLASNGAVTCVYNGEIGGTVSGTAPASANNLAVMRLGARNGTTATSFGPVMYADWVWCAGFVPSNAQITELMSGKRPGNIANFTPTFYWPMEGATTTEASIPAGATLTANTLPANVIGPYYTLPVSEDILPLLMF